MTNKSYLLCPAFTADVFPGCALTTFGEAALAAPALASALLTATISTVKISVL